jgi:hypothetical protein
LEKKPLELQDIYGQACLKSFFHLFWCACECTTNVTYRLSTWMTWLTVDTFLYSDLSMYGER